MASDTVRVGCPGCGVEGFVYQGRGWAPETIECSSCLVSFPTTDWLMVDPYSERLRLPIEPVTVDKCATCVDENQAQRKADLVLKTIELAFELEEMADDQPDTEAAKAMNFCAKRIRGIMS